MLLRRPSVQSRVIGSSVPYSSTTVQALINLEANRDNSERVIKAKSKDHYIIIIAEIISYLWIQNVQFRRYIEARLRFAQCFNDYSLTTAGGAYDHRRVSGHHHFVQLHDFVDLD